jgi:mRNA interferase MazF
VTFRAKSRPSVYLPDRGDIVHTDFSPSAGSELALKHFAVVLTPKSYHEKTGRAIVCPITSKTRDFPFNLPIPAIPPYLTLPGAILTDQVRVLDLYARGSHFAGRIGAATLRDIVDLLFTLLEDQA